MIKKCVLFVAVWIISVIIGCLLGNIAYGGEIKSRSNYSSRNVYQGQYRPGLGGSYNYYDNYNRYRGRISPNNIGGYNIYDEKNTYRGRAYLAPRADWKN